MGTHLILKNKKAYFNYHILDVYEAGVALTGPEIKSIRNGDVSLDGSFILVRLGNAEIINMNIKNYEFTTNVGKMDPTRTRQLLLHKREINKILEKIKLEKVTVVPLKLYFKGRWAKLEIGLGKGKNVHDKREVIKKRDTERLTRLKF